MDPGKKEKTDIKLQIVFFDYNKLAGYGSGPLSDSDATATDFLK